MKKILLLICVAMAIFLSACGKTEEKTSAGLDTTTRQYIEVAVEANDDEEDTIDYANGECGKSLRWTLSQDGVLVISGSGEMSDFPYDDSVPWNDHRDLITTVILEEGVSSIGRYAFIRCANLKDVEIADSVTKIELSAFQKCTSLSSVKLPDNIEEISKQVFTGCSSLKSVELPDSLQRIQDFAFSNCSRLESISLPSGTWYVGNNVFEECENLKYVEMSESVKVIGSSAFAFCNNLESINIPTRVTNLSNAFIGCTSLKNVYFEGDAPTISNRCFSDVSANCYYPAGNTTWTISKMSDYDGSLTWKEK